MTRNNSLKKWLIEQARLLLTCLAVILPLCLAGRAQGDTGIGGTINSNYTATLANSPYVVNGDITVSSGAKLTIEPGVVFKFNGGMSMWINGELDARGTADLPITFTSSNAVNPGVGSWGAITINNNGVATLDYCLVRYGGLIGYYTEGLIKKSGAGALTISNTTIDTFYGNAVTLTDATGAVAIGSSTIDGKVLYNSRNGVVISGATSGGNITISGNTIKNINTTYNGMILQNGAAPHINGNSFTNSSGFAILVNSGAAPLLDTTNTFTSTGSGWEMGFDAASSGVAHTYDNTLSAPVVITGGTITSPAGITWSSARTYYVIGNITVNSGASLSLQPGCVVKSAGSTVYVSGTFSAGSGAGGKTYFTSYRDGTIGAAIRGATGAADPRDWGSFFVNAGAAATIANCEFRYGGLTPPYDTGMIKKSGGGNLTVTNSTFSNYNTYAIKLDGTTDSVTIAGNSIQAVGYYSTYCIYANNAGGSTSISGNSMTSSNPSFDCLVVNNGAPLISGNTTTGGLSGIKITSTVASSPVISANTITGAATGISVSGATSTPQIFKNSITGNGVGIYATSSANPVIGGTLGNGNNLYNNTTWSVQNATSASPPQINARFNYWGGAAGPYHASTNTGGNQNSKVTDNVDYADWSSPSSGSIAINGGAAYTTLADVIIDFACSDASGCETIAISNDNTTFSQLDFISSTGWIINEAQGSTTVSVKFRYGSGAWSPVYQAAIILDSIPPDPPVVTGSTPNQGQGLVWNWTSGGGGNGRYRYQMRGDTVWTKSTDTSLTRTADLQAGEYVLAVQECDEAGNWSASGIGNVLLKADNWLTTTVTGYGAIQGTSTMGQGYSSTTGPNTASFALNDQISLSATPATDFAFAGWTGDCTAANGPCTLYMVADRNVAAGFTTTKTALLLSPAMSAHASLGAAYIAAPIDGSVTILGRDTTFEESLLLDRNVTVTLLGGYDASFSTVGGLSTVKGTVKVASGRLNAAGLTIR